MFPKLVTGEWKALLVQDGLRPKEVKVKFTDTEVPAVLDLIKEYKEYLMDEGWEFEKEEITWS